MPCSSPLSVPCHAGQASRDHGDTVHTAGVEFLMSAFSSQVQPCLCSHWQPAGFGVLSSAQRSAQRGWTEWRWRQAESSSLVAASDLRGKWRKWRALAGPALPQVAPALPPSSLRWQLEGQRKSRQCQEACQGSERRRHHVQGPTKLPKSAVSCLAARDHCTVGSCSGCRSRVCSAVCLPLGGAT